MSSVAHMTNEIRQMLYNFGYRAAFNEDSGKVTCTLTQVDSHVEVAGAAGDNRFEAVVQAYMALLRTLNPASTGEDKAMSGPAEKDAATPLATDRLAEMIRGAGYQVVLEPDKSGYGWRGAVFVGATPIVYTDYAATKFDALTHSMGFLIQHLENRTRHGDEATARVA